MKKKYMILLSALSLASSTFAQTWIWYPGDYEIWLGNQMNNRRTERGAFFPPFWKTDSHYVVVEFSKQLNLSEPEEIFIAAEGKYNVKLDGKLQFGMPETMPLPAGKHDIIPLAFPLSSIHSLSSYVTRQEESEFTVFPFT